MVSQLRSVSLLLLLLAGLWMVDNLLWSLTNMLNRADKLGNLDPLQKVVGDGVLRARDAINLEKAYQDAETPAQRKTAAFELIEHLKKMKKDARIAALYRELVGAFPADRGKHLQRARWARIETARREGDQAAVLSQARTLRSLALREPVEKRLLEALLKWAAQHKYGDFRRETLKLATQVDSLDLKTRIQYLETLVRLYGDAGSEADLAKANALKQRLAEERERERRVKALSRKIDKVLKEGDAAQAWTLLEELAADFPGGRPTLAGVYRKVLTAAIHAGDEATTLKVWDVFTQMPALATHKLEKITPADWMSRNLYGTARTLLENGREDVFLKLMPPLLKEWPDMPIADLLRGELWARTGRTGKPPKPLYLIKKISPANVTIDGKLSEPVYASLSPLPGGWYMADAQYGPLHPAGAWKPRVVLFYTDTHLYLGGTFPELEPDTIKRYLANPDDPALYVEEAVDLFFDADRDLGDYEMVTGTIAHNNFLRLYHPGKMERDWYIFGKEREGSQDNNKQVEAAWQFGPKGFVWEIRTPLRLIFDNPEHLSGRLTLGTVRSVRMVEVPGNGKKKKKDGQSVITIAWSPMGYGHQLHAWDFFQFE